MVVDGTLYVDIRWNEIRWDEIRWDWYGDGIVQLLCTTITNKTFSASLSLEIMPKVPQETMQVQVW